MALQPSLSPLLVGNPAAPHTLEVYIDYICPWSRKIFLNLDQYVKPKITTGGKYEGKVKLIVRLLPQPWHYATTYTQEAALAVARVEPQAFWDYSIVLFKEQERFYNQKATTLTPLQIREQLLELLGHADLSNFAGLKSKSKEILELISNKTTPNGGVDVTDDQKYNIKISRQNSIHVTPTALWDGLVENSISSGWGDAEYSKFFSEKVTV